MDSGRPVLAIVQAVKDVVQHESHFILEILDNSFGSLAMGACVNLGSRKVFNLRRLVKEDKEKVKALGVIGEVSDSRVRVVWMVVDGGKVGARLVSNVVAKEWDFDKDTPLQGIYLRIREGIR
nr:hypothetical protein [Tanacetum cinerariifolium]